MLVRSLTRGLAALLLLSACAAESVGAPSVETHAGGCSGTASRADAAVFFVRGATGGGACGFDYQGDAVGRALRYPRCLEACAEVQPSPDGRYALTGRTVTSTRTGRTVVNVPDDMLGPRWADDSRHLCSLQDARFGLVVSDLGGHATRVDLPDVFGAVRHSNIDLLACDPRHDRVVLVARYQHLTGIAVIRLSNGELLAEHDFTDTSGGLPTANTPIVTAAVASPDGRFLAVQHALQPAFTSPTGSPPSPSPVRSGSPAVVAVTPPVGAPQPVPTQVDIFDLSRPGAPVARLNGGNVVGFSGNGAFVVESRLDPTAGVSSARLLAWATGRVLWQTSDFVNGMATPPGAPTVAAEIYHSGWKQDRVVLIHPDGSSRTVTTGELATS